MQVALELEQLSPGTSLDGELVALDANGVPCFSLLQNYRTGAAHLMYFAFDVLTHSGRNIATLPLNVRRKLLHTIVKRGLHLDLAAWSSDPGGMERFAREHRREGIVAKRLNTPFAQTH